MESKTSFSTWLAIMRRKNSLFGAVMSIAVLTTQFMPPVTQSYNTFDFSSLDDQFRAHVSDSICREYLGVGSKSPLSKLCRDKPSLFDHARRGFQKGIQECRDAFRSQRWNCTTEEGKARYKLFGTPMSRNSKEAAVMFAIISAGMVEHITRETHKGKGMEQKSNMKKCSHEVKEKLRKTQGYVHLNSCDYDIGEAEVFAKDVLDTWDPKENMYEWLMNKHNSQVGRKSVSLNMRLTCRCMGLSGACNAKCCFKTLQPLKTSVQWLKSKYHNAVKVNSSQRRKRDGSGKLVTANFKPPQKTDLIYLLDSPNYCNKDMYHGTIGTQGRLCNATGQSFSGEHCERICCGRGYVKHKIMKKQQCNCKFTWCCEVSCEECERHVTEYRCK